MSDEKKKRSAAKGRFTRIANNLEKCITDPNGDGDDVQQTFGDLESSWKNVEIKHEEYISTLDENANFQPEETWIDEIERKYRDIRKRYVQFQSNRELLHERASREKGREIAFDTFSQLSKNLKTSITNGYPVETIEREKIILEKQFETVKSKHSEFVMISDNTRKEENQKWLKILIETFGSINSIADKYILSDVKKPIPKLETKTAEKIKGNLKMERMPLPKFDGEPRYYPRFKKDLKELVLPNLEKQEAVFTLRQC